MQILDRAWTESGQTLDRYWTRTGQQAVEPASEGRMNSLHGLAPKAKARRFRALLPIIEAKIQAGVCHADIMRALKEQGLALLENTYFTYLRRYRGKQSIAERRGAQAAAPSAVPAAAESLPVAGQPGEHAAHRPPTFDYDPRGIPELLK